VAQWAAVIIYLIYHVNAISGPMGSGAIHEILSFCSNVSTKTFHLPAAHWAAVSQFSRHFHIVEKKTFKHSFSQNMLIFKVRQVKKKLKLISYLYQFIRKKKATKKQPKAKFSKLTYK
jgi:hypothetical protein